MYQNQRHPHRSPSGRQEEPRLSELLSVFVNVGCPRLRVHGCHTKPRGQVPAEKTVETGFLFKGNLADNFR